MLIEVNKSGNSYDVSPQVKVESNKAITITDNGLLEILPTQGNVAMQKVTATINVSPSGYVPVTPESVDGSGAFDYVSDVPLEVLVKCPYDFGSFLISELPPENPQLGDTWYPLIYESTYMRQVEFIYTKPDESEEWYCWETDAIMSSISSGDTYTKYNLFIVSENGEIA